jgi:hypothetical protein
MSKPAIKVHVRALVAAGGGMGVFLGNEQKAFVMRIDGGAPAGAIPAAADNHAADQPAGVVQYTFTPALAGRW